MQVRMQFRNKTHTQKFAPILGALWELGKYFATAQEVPGSPPASGITKQNDIGDAFSLERENANLPDLGYDKPH